MLEREILGSVIILQDVIFKRNNFDNIYFFVNL